MDQNAEHIVKVIDATARDDEADNEQKAINHSLRALTGMGAIPQRSPGSPWYAVSIDPSRHWDTSKGAMPVAIRAEISQGLPPQDVVDVNVTRDVVLCGDRIGYWRVHLEAGKADVSILVNEYEEAGEGQLFVLDAAEPDRQGSTPTFTWSADTQQRSSSSSAPTTAATRTAAPFATREETL